MLKLRLPGYGDKIVFVPDPGGRFRREPSATGFASSIPSLPCLLHPPQAMDSLPAMPKWPAAVIFDFDGVLANSEPLHLRAFQEVAAAEKIDLTEHEYYNDL